MQIIFFGIVVFFALFLNILSAQGFFNVKDDLFWKQTKNLLSQNQPSSIKIDAVKINAPIERVGIDDQGKMVAPSNAGRVAWYQFSSLPGQKGNLILSGHKDSTFGPGAFYTLKNIDLGEIIEIANAQHESYYYETVDKKTYLSSQLPVQQIFTQQTKDKIAYLITCEGNFNFFSKSYNQRILVKAILSTNKT